MKIRKKLILAGFAILSLLITTVTTTFAWFSLNDAAWVGDFEMEIYNTDQLLVRHESGEFKQLLTNKDVVAAVNDSMVFKHIDSLDDIKLTSVHSMDGKSFDKIIHTYDSMNRISLEWRRAEQNEYLEFKLIFRVDDAEAKDGQIHPDYYLVVSDSEEQEGVKKTSFTSESQVVRLANSLTTQDKIYNMDETITVNPVNAMRLSIMGDPEGPNSKVDYIYELGDDSDLGSYAIDSSVLNYLGISDKNYSQGRNAAFTYYNNINNHILYPIGYNVYNYDEEVLENEAKQVKDLLNKLKHDFNDDLGIFKYDEETQTYNDLSITIRLWIEGFDADNLIGLDPSSIKCLFSFKLKEVTVNEQDG